MEPELRGTPGEIRYEVDARNMPVRRLPGGRRPIPGNDVYLSIDINLQYLAEKALAAQLKVVSSKAICDPGGLQAGRHIGQRGGREPQGRDDPRHGVVPDLRPVRVHRRHQHGGVQPAHLRGQPPAARRQGDLRHYARLHVKPFSAYAGLSRTGQITPRLRVDDPEIYKVPSARTPVGASASSRASSQGVDGRSISPRRSRIERHVLLQARRLHVAPPDQLGEDTLAKTDS